MVSGVKPYNQVQLNEERTTAGDSTLIHKH